MRYPIQFKIVIVFCTVIFLCFSALLFVSYSVTQTNMYRTIQEDMTAVKTNLNVYVNQYFLINNKKMDSDTPASEKNKLTQELTAMFSGTVNVWDTASLRKIEPASAYASTASSNAAAYQIHKHAHTLTTTLDIPMQADGSVIGIVRLQKDYRELYESNEHYYSALKIFTILMFSFVFILSIFISNMITKPLRQLTDRTRQAAQGDFDTDISIHSQDEIGELSRSFKTMLERIQNQILIIEQERDEVKKLQVQNKLFFDNVTHELKTPLTSIQGHAQIIKENEFSDYSFFSKGLDYIIRESNRLNDRVVKLLDTSRAARLTEEYRYRSHDLSLILKEACEDMSIKAMKYNMDIRSQIESDLFVFSDYEKIKAVFLNILDNSIKYGHVNSSIVVHAYRESSFAVISIQDEGEEITEAHMEHIFDPFYRGSPQKEKGSAGLDLSIVKKIVDDHKGTIRLHSQIGIGTQAKIQLPGEWA